MVLKSLCMGVASALLMIESASALSCMRPDLAKTMETAKASETVYSILVGTFETPPPQQMTQEVLRPEDQFKPRPPVITPAKFTGYAITPSVETDPKLTQFPLDIETSCVGPWCSSIPSSDQERILFVEMRPKQSPVLKISPCPQWVFPLQNGQDQVEKLRDCLDKTCVSDAVNGFPQR